MTPTKMAESQIPFPTRASPPRQYTPSFKSVVFTSPHLNALSRYSYVHGLYTSSLQAGCKVIYIPKKKMLRDVLIHLSISVVGILISVSAFFVLFIICGNHDVGFWSILAGALSGVCFHLHWVRGKETLERWHTRVTLRNLNVVGFISAVTGVTALIWYLFLTFYYKIPIQPISESTVISAVWSMICGKWGIILMYYSNKYELLVQEGTSSILTDSA